jgi:hypothetical protein
MASKRPACTQHSLNWECLFQSADADFLQKIGPDERTDGSQTATDDLRAVPMKGGECQG